MRSSGHFPLKPVSRAEVVRVAGETVGTLEGFDAGALVLALRRTRFDEQADLHHAAASLMEGLLSFHPFALGNEEIARRVVALLYEKNGWRLADDVEVARLIADMGAGRASALTGAAVLARSARRGPP